MLSQAKRINQKVITMKKLSIEQFITWQNNQTPFLLLDVRRKAVREQQGKDIPNAKWCDPALWLDWKDHIQTSLPIVVYCAKGHEISQGLTATLSTMGHDAYYLEGGFVAWQTTQAI